MIDAHHVASELASQRRTTDPLIYPGVSVSLQVWARLRWQMMDPTNLLRALQFSPPDPIILARISRQ
ncbi:MAG: hypothetical protein M2R45_03876 [Verrucomicrobia subdivision 3 bacterium]|nr:hypothetical protein [Limisphaerales bacterium]MCS1412580.1 hypothetical protein [Limisphaerales bacterium]